MREVEGKTLKDIVQYGLKAVLDLLVPRRCIVCESALASSEKHLCRECLDDIPHTYYWLRKFNPMADRFNALIQEDAEQHSAHQDGQLSSRRIDYSFAVALFFYCAESGYRRIPYQIKYHGDIPAGRFFGRMLGEKVAFAEHFADVDTVIPVPLHWVRQWRRGYNQAEVIAREVAIALGAELRTDILERRRRTHTQTKLTIEGKAANVKGAFRVKSCNSNKTDASALSDLKHLLIVDDVFTTGSTLYACYSALRAVLPPSVRISVATLAFVGEA